MSPSDLAQRFMLPQNRGAGYTESGVGVYHGRRVLPRNSERWDASGAMRGKTRCQMTASGEGGGPQRVRIAALKVRFAHASPRLSSAEAILAMHA